MSDRSVTTYGVAICDGFKYLLSNYPEVFVIGQGLWSPWYVGQSMTALDTEYGVDRIIDTPVSEASCTGVAIGASLCGYRPIVVHPRMDFMILATDQMVNQAAKWHHMLGGETTPAVTIRGIINRGGEQGAQHSQALHSWYSHIPGLRVVMPATAKDARDLLISSVLCDAPVLYIDDRWLYEEEDVLPPVVETKLENEGPAILHQGSDITLVGVGFSTSLCMKAMKELEKTDKISCEVIDLRILNPLNFDLIESSIKKTGRLLVCDGGWKNCGMAGEIIASASERIEPSEWRSKPVRLTLKDAPAPTSSVLEDIYYTKKEDVINSVRSLFS